MREFGEEKTECVGICGVDEGKGCFRQYMISSNYEVVYNIMLSIRYYFTIPGLPNLSALIMEILRF